MNKDKTEIVFILDRSGSMASIAADMRGGFDTLIEEQKKVGGECLVTLAQFDDQYEIVYEGKPIAEVPKLELVPRGGTALLDAVGRTIAATGERLAKMPEVDRPARVLVAIITDGQENRSIEYTAAQVAAMIAHQKEAYAWSFLFLGADANAIEVAKSYGISAQGAVRYSKATRGGAQAAMRGVSYAMKTSREAEWSGRAAPMAYSQVDYDRDLKAATPSGPPKSR